MKRLDVYLKVKGKETAIVTTLSEGYFISGVDVVGKCRFVVLCIDCRNDAVNLIIKI